MDGRAMRAEAADCQEGGEVAMEATSAGRLAASAAALRVGIDASALC